MITLKRLIEQFKQNYPKVKRYEVYVRFSNLYVIGDEDECWEWQGRCSHDNYGFFAWPEKDIHYAHIAAYVLFISNIPKQHGSHKLHVCHSCDNPKCVNPKHLWLGTSKQNSEDMVNKNRQSKGEHRPAAKLTYKQAKKIRKLYKTGNYTFNRLSKKFSIAEKIVFGIIHGTAWKERT